ncbi:MAG: polysaccharide biosynthesis/export family protein [Prevotella sp.]|nr:polysaccharide biosynthesis/export family protein [Bacteroides sp.]MCM1366853.1 polysaccharide biosynthesis/export family protein [Prevotella sp.]MCM1437421.1 polysaccharide biosynthesis/export family protein [Prevotella sp.]
MRKTIYLLLLALIVCSCKSNQQLAYFVDLQGSPEGIIPLQRQDIKIEPEDELLINVTSEVPEASSAYNLPFNVPGGKDNILTNTTTSEKQTYIVDRAGNINFPVLGRIHVEGLTTRQLAEELTRRIAVDVEAPYVRVELINFRIKVMGEVLKPGSYKFDTERVSVLDALAEAGDMTIFGRRDNVTIWREENGTATYHKLNLNDSKIINSPYYYLKQNDVVYVEPGEAKAGQSEYNQNNSFKVSVVSTIVSGCSVIASLLIALLAK